MNIEYLLDVASFSPQVLDSSDLKIGHLPFAAWIIREVAPTVYVELGTAKGHIYFTFCQSVAKAGLATRCYAINTWHDNADAGVHGDEVFAKINAYNKARFNGFSQLWRMPTDQALSSFAEKSIQMLHIDGQRPYEAVHHDFESWFPKLASGAVVIISGTNMPEQNFSGCRVWEELRCRYIKNMTFAHAGGLGVLQIDTAHNEQSLEWLGPDFPLKWAIISYFQALGLDHLAHDEHGREIERFKQTLDRSEEVTTKLHNDIVQRNNTILSLENDLFSRDEQLIALRASSSWRITRPLRKLRRLLALVIARKSLVSTLSREIWQQIRLHGLFRVLHRFPTYYWSNRHKALSRISHRSPSGTYRMHPDLVPGSKQIDATISIVIPTLNAGPEFPVLLRKLSTQRGLSGIEIVIVDSGSTDETVKIARKAGCTVVEIAPAEFSHSYARNRGASAASGRYLLFMVQDAYPIGNYWAYGMLSYLLEHGDRRLAAVSCAEYSRSDSDMMYDSLINTHYGFLGCQDCDRLGEFQGDDHMALRCNGQLSDVACLISKDLFDHYRYRGDYAEDLDLGIRLLRNGFRVAMMSSVKVIHSHNRPAFYYLKRGFVDLVFLASLFTDYPCSRILSPQGVIAGIVSVAAHLSQWYVTFDASCSTENLQRELEMYISRWRKEFRRPLLNRQPCRLDHGSLDAFIDSLADRYLTVSEAEPTGKFGAEIDGFLDTFIARIDHFNTFASKIYIYQDKLLREQLREMVLKTFAATAGTSLGFMFIASNDFEPSDRHIAEMLADELKSGV